MSELECCCECDEPTGRAGRADDSLYGDDGETTEGPFCEECYEDYIRNQMVVELRDGFVGLDRDVKQLRAERSALMEALTASVETKVAYSGEFELSHEVVDDDEDLGTETHVIPWTVMKDIMAAIRRRAEERQTK